MKKFSLFMEFLLPLLEHNVILSDALHILSEEGDRNAYYIEENIKKGKSLSVSVKETFPEKSIKKYLFLLQAAEETGQLLDTVKKINSLIKKEESSQKNLMGVFLYPIGIIILSICATVTLLVKGIPLFASYGMITTGDISSIIQSIWKAFLLLFILSGFFLIFLYRIFNPAYRLSSLFYYLYLFTSSSVSLDKALLRTLSFFDNLKLKKALLSIKEQIEKGVSVSFAFKESNFFPKTVLSWISISETQGEIESTFLFLSLFYEESEMNRIQKAEKVSEPVSLIITACYLGYLIQGAVVPLLTSFGGL